MSFDTQVDHGNLIQPSKPDRHHNDFVLVDESRDTISSNISLLPKPKDSIDQEYDGNIFDEKPLHQCIQDLTRKGPSIEARKLAFPGKLIEILQSEPEGADQKALLRWKELGSIDIEEIIGNSANNPRETMSATSSVEEYLKY